MHVIISIWKDSLHYFDGKSYVTESPTYFQTASLLFVAKTILTFLLFFWHFFTVYSFWTATFLEDFEMDKKKKKLKPKIRAKKCISPFILSASHIYRRRYKSFLARPRSTKPFQQTFILFNPFILIATD